MFHMLLSHEYRYYTIFAQTLSEGIVGKFEDVLCEIIAELGEIYSIEVTEDGAIEFWIKPADMNDPCVFYLFPYEAGVVYYE